MRVALPPPETVAGGLKVQVIVPVAPPEGEVDGLRVPPWLELKLKPGGRMSFIWLTVSAVPRGFEMVSVKSTGLPATTWLALAVFVKVGATPQLLSATPIIAVCVPVTSGLANQVSFAGLPASASTSDCVR